MKIGDLEGTPDEIKDFISNSGFNAQQYFKVPDRPIRLYWLLGLAMAFLIILLVMTLVTDMPARGQKALLLVALTIGLTGIVITQLRFNSGWATSAVAIGVIGLASVAYGTLTPEQALEKLEKSFMPKKSD